MNKHLINIVQEYISKSLPFTTELLTKTSRILYDITTWRFYENYVIKYDYFDNDSRIYNIGNIIRNKYTISYIKLFNNWEILIKN